MYCRVHCTTKKNHSDIFYVDFTGISNDIMTDIMRDGQKRLRKHGMRRINLDIIKKLPNTSGKITIKKNWI